VTGRALLLLLALVTGGSPAAATPSRFGEWLCEPLIRAAEKSEGIPPGLLLAIGRAESGVDTSWGRVVWPWALNVAGRSVFLQTREEALHHARESIAADTRRFIDLGCLQINWQFHREWLKDPDHVLDPSWNVAYGARLLRNLAAQHGSWERAVGYYHSANPQRQATYLANIARHYCDADTRTAALCQQRVPVASNAPVRRTVVRIIRGAGGDTKGGVTQPGSGAPPKMILLR